MNAKFDFRAYRLEEVKIARSRIDQEISSMNSNEALAFTYMAAVYAAMFQFRMSDRALLWLVPLLPICISIYSLMRYNAQRHALNCHESYVKSIEKEITRLRPDFKGLAHHYDDRKTGTLKVARQSLWTALIVGTTAFWLWCVADPGWAACVIRTAKD